MNRTGQKSVTVSFQTDLPLSDFGPLAVRVEELGFSGVTLFNDLFYKPCWLPLLEVARATRRVRVGPAAVNPFTNHPVNLAGNIALLDEASGGRAYLGLSRGSWLDSLGLRNQRPVRALQESMECVRHLLRRETHPYEGEIYQLAPNSVLRWEPRPDIPFLLGSWGTLTLRRCLPMIDEVKLGGTASPQCVQAFKAELESIASELQSEVCGIVAGCVTVVDEDGRRARELARRRVSLYIPVVAPLDRTFDSDEAELTQMGQLAAAGRFEDAAGLVTDEMLDRFAIAGTPDQVVAKIEALFDAGADRVELGSPHGHCQTRGLELLGRRVLPALGLNTPREVLK